MFSDNAVRLQSVNAPEMSASSAVVAPSTDQRSVRGGNVTA